jgi:deoxyribodipyrimidine photolyase-related protein
VDDLLSRRLQRAFDSLSMNGVAYASPMFLTPTDALERCFRGKRKPLMGRFYQEQRCRLGILVENDGSPIGGKWSFDAENRKPMPKRGLDVPPLAWPEASHEVDQAVARVNRRYPESLGQAEGFAYPVTHAEAERWLEGFLRERLSQFGDYEDAIGEREAFLFHGVLTPMLNVGLLTPQQVIDGALRQAEEGAVPLNSLEGLVRQVIGWREFMRGAYLHLGVASRNANFWGFEDRPIPQAFYEGTTGIPPVDTVIQRVMTHGWCHHIERLMVLGNFMMLCGLHPHRVYQWFMECFVDAYDWVMVPNVYGMSQFADGGFFTTKPYLSGSNYVRKMSDFRPGEWCEVWDGLFWSFIESNEVFFRKQHRLGMMVRQLERMDAAKRMAHRRNAETFLKKLYA